MTDTPKSKAELLHELDALRQRIAELEAEQVSQKRAEFEIIFEAIPDAVLYADPNRIIRYVNPAVKRVFGYEPAELIGQPTRILYADEQDFYEQGRIRFNTDAPSQSALYEVLFRHKNGAAFLSENTGTAVRDSTGKHLGNLAIIRDISQRKIMEEALRQSESRLAEAQRIAHVGHWIWNLGSQELQWSNEIYRIFGRLPQEFKAVYEQFLGLVHPDDRPLVESAVRSALRGQSPYSIDHRIVLPNGDIRIVHEQGEVTYNEVGEPVQMMGTMHDITERKEMENTVRRSQQLLEGTLTALRDIVWSVDAQAKKLLYVNPAIEIVYGVPAANFYMDNMLWLKMIHPDDLDAVSAAARQQNVTGYAELEFRIVRPDGEVRWLYERSRIIYDDDTDQPLRVDSISTDITARKLAEQELQKTAALLATSRDALRRLIEQLPVGIQVFDRDGLCTDLNKAQMRIFGVNRRRDIVEVYNIFEDRLAASIGTQAAAKRALRGATIYMGDLNFDFDNADPRFARTSGKRVINVTIFPIFDQNHEVVNIVGLNYDVTERREAERQQLDLAVKTERVRVLEDLISDISHDFKTPLSIITTNLYLLKKHTDATNLKYVERSETHLNRLAKLIDGLLTISRLNQGVMLQTMPTNLNLLLGTLIDLKEAIISEKKQDVWLKLTTQPTIVQGNPDELTRVFENLIDNALNYTPRQGSIIIRTTRENSYIQVEISDTGIGIEPQDLERIFDRFYRSDKARSTHTGGSGLGLAIVKKIIEMHGGKIMVESQADKGSTFRILLPHS